MPRDRWNRGPSFLQNLRRLRPGDAPAGGCGVVLALLGFGSLSLTDAIYRQVFGGTPWAYGALVVMFCCAVLWGAAVILLVYASFQGLPLGRALGRERPAGLPSGASCGFSLCVLALAWLGLLLSQRSFEPGSPPAVGTLVAVGLLSLASWVGWRSPIPPPAAEVVDGETGVEIELNVPSSLADVPPGWSVRETKSLGVQASQHCPYCREGLAGVRAIELVSCEGCQAVLHLACLHEAGRCPTSGCDSGLTPR